MRTLLTAAAVAALLATPAFAADMVQSPEPAPAPVTTPAPAGYDWTGFYIGGQLGYGWADAAPGNDGSFIGGLNAGYNYDMGNWVVGVEGDYNFANMNVGGGTGVDGLAHAKVKVGADLGRTLLYGTGGLAYARGDSSENKFGYVVGAGVDFAVTNNTFVGAEYGFNHFSNVGPANTDIDVHEFTARVGYKF